MLDLYWLSGLRSLIIFLLPGRPGVLKLLQGEPGFTGPNASTRSAEESAGDWWIRRWRRTDLFFSPLVDPSEDITDLSLGRWRDHDGTRLALARGGLYWSGSSEVAPNLTNPAQ